MVVLQVLLEQGALSDGMDLDDLASRSHDFLIRSPELFADLENVKELPDPRNPTPDKWSSYWISNPIRAWCGAGSAGGRRWFSVDGNRFVAHLPEVDPTILAELTAELVDARLVEYRRRRKGKIAVGSFLADFDWQGNEPVLRLRGDDEFAEIGNCTLEAVGPDGRAWSFPFVNGTARWVQRVGRSGNALEGLLGSDARRVAEGNRALRFTHGPDGWAFGLATTGSVEAVSWGAWDWFPVRSMDPQGTLELSAGPAGDGRVRLPGPRKPGETAVKVSEGVVGLPDVVVAGDWLVVDFPADHSNDDEFCWVLDWSGVAEGGYWNVPTTHVREPVDRVWAPGNADNLEPRTAYVVRRWSPDQLAPDPGETLAMLAPWFGLHREPAGVMDWVDGHCFLCFEGTGPLERPDRYSGEGVAAAPGETAFVFARGSGDDSWTFLGIGRWKAHHCEWEFPPPPLSLWRLLSSRRSASRTLPRNWVDAAARFAEEAGVGLVGKTVQKGGAVWSVLGSTNGGGIAIERSNGGGSRRIVTATDLGWALAAENDVARFGGILSEARVNRLRYLYGTPKEATRWIDTGWAIALLRLWRSSNPSDDSIDERA